MKIYIVGLGYLGLPIAIQFRSLRCTRNRLDIDAKKVESSGRIVVFRLIRSILPGKRARVDAIPTSASADEINTWMPEYAFPSSLGPP
jgi:hypothetical protein